MNPDRTERSDPNSEKNPHNNRPEPSTRSQNDKQRVKGNKPASHSLRHASRVMNCLKITGRFTYRFYDYTATAVKRETHPAVYVRGANKVIKYIYLTPPMRRGIAARLTLLLRELRAH